MSIKVTANIKSCEIDSQERLKEGIDKIEVRLDSDGTDSVGT